MTKKHIPKTVRKVSLKFDAIFLTKQLMVRKKVHMMNTLLSEDFKKCTRSDRYAEVKLFKDDTEWWYCITTSSQSGCLLTRVTVACSMISGRRVVSFKWTWFWWIRFIWKHKIIFSTPVLNINEQKSMPS